MCAAGCLDRMIPNAHFAPIVIGRDINGRHIALNLSSLAIDARPIGMREANCARIDDFAHESDMAKAHIAMWLEYHDSALLRAIAARIFAIRLIPPCARITIDLDARHLPGNGNALQIGRALRKRRRRRRRYDSGNACQCKAGRDEGFEAVFHVYA